MKLQPLSSFFILLPTIHLALAATIPSPQNIESPQQEQPSASPPPSQPPSNDTGLAFPMFPILKGANHCSPTAFLSLYYLTIPDCASAISKLPSSIKPSYFHMGEPFDESSLPVTKTAKYCRVTVEMMDRIGGDEDISSWLQVSHAASQLNLHCGSQYPRRYGQGWATTGEKNGIRISLAWKSGSPPALGKETTYKS